MGSLEYELDEVYPFIFEGGRLENPFYGMATIGFNSDEDWWLDELTSSASNGRTGDACKSWDQPIKRTHWLFDVVDTFLQIVERERIEEIIRDHIKNQRDSYLYDLGKERAKERIGARP